MKIISDIVLYLDWYAIIFTIIFLLLILRLFIVLVFVKHEKWRKFRFNIYLIMGAVMLWFISFGFFYDLTHYPGSKNFNTGQWCDYGYNPKEKECCDESDYTCEVCSGYAQDYSCDSFSDFNANLYDSQHEAAQELYEMCSNYNPDKKDVFNLDRDGDGVACESLLEQ